MTTNDDILDVEPEAAALSAVRRYCRWHVAPVITETITLDGPGGLLVALPTLQMEIDSIEVIEDGVPVDPASLEVSARGLVRRTDGAYWTRRYSGLEVTLTHGFDEAEDFWGVVTAYQEREASFGTPTKVGPFTFGTDEMGVGSVFTAAEKSVLDLYRLEAGSV